MITGRLGGPSRYGRRGWRRNPAALFRGKTPLRAAYAILGWFGFFA
jgi:hypothetical protein